jgi:hypothetical protein
MSQETIFSKVKGTSFHRPPFAFMQIGDALDWKRAPDNQYDANAIELWWQGQMIGHIAKEIAADLAPKLDDNTLQLAVTITDLTGGQQVELIPGATKTKHRGINIQLVIQYTDLSALAFPSEPTPDFTDLLFN